MGNDEKRRQPQADADAGQGEAAGTGADLPCTANVDRLLKAVAGDRKLLARLVTTFLEDYPEKLETIRGAVQGADAKSLERAAHSYRGALTILGAEDACWLAARLEAFGKSGVLTEAAPLVRELEAETERLADFLAEKAGLPPLR